MYDYLTTQIMAQLRGTFNNIKGMPACENRTRLINQFLEYADGLKAVKDEPVQTNTRLYYLYRDASNWKTLNSVVLKGKITDEMHNEMKSCCEDGVEMFIPEQVGLDLIRDWETTMDDHPYAELGEYELVPNEPTTDMTVEELLEEFRKAKDNWNPADYEPIVEEFEEE